jgi:hypothetical protein
VDAGTGDGGESGADGAIDNETGNEELEGVQL